MAAENMAAIAGRGRMRVFLSYAGEDRHWKDNFVHCFAPALGSAALSDYRDTAVPTGDLSEALRRRIAEANVFVALISRDYVAKKHTLLEFEEALSVAQPGRAGGPHAFAALIMDNDAEDWWEKQRASGRLPPWLTDYAYSDFRNQHGSAPQVIVAANGQICDDVDQKIKNLARCIARTIGGAQDNKGAQPGDADPAAPPPVVLLGHPTGNSISRIADAAQGLGAALASGGREPVVVPDGWFNEGLDEVPEDNGAGTALRETLDDLLRAGAVFVQPTAPGEAREHARTPDTTLDRLQQCAGRDAPEGAIGGGDGQAAALPRIVIWLPHGQAGREFETRATAQADANPAFRTDDPHGLAAWLLRPGRNGETVPVLAFEEWSGKPNWDTAAIFAKLRSGLEASVRDVLDRKPPFWGFCDDMLLEQLRALSDRKAIIAVHDLNTSFAATREEAQRSLEQKLGEVEADIQPVLDELGSAKPDLFRVALLAQHGRHMPFVDYPVSGRFEEWRLLRFVGAGRELEPDQGATKVFRNYVSRWVAATGAPAAP